MPRLVRDVRHGDQVGLDPADCGTHSMRLGHSELESTVRYLGIEVDDALEISEQTEI